jgi:hypothetical protein
MIFNSSWALALRPAAATASVPPGGKNNSTDPFDLDGLGRLGIVIYFIFLIQNHLNPHKNSKPSAGIG